MPVDAGKSFGWCSLPSGVLPDMLSGIKKVQPRKTGISNPLSTNRLGHFLTADCKSAETPSGTEETYPAERTFWLTAIDNVYIHNSLYFKLINF